MYGYNRISRGVNKLSFLEILTLVLEDAPLQSGKPMCKQEYGVYEKPAAFAPLTVARI